MEELKLMWWVERWRIRSSDLAMGVGREDVVDRKGVQVMVSVSEPEEELARFGEGQLSQWLCCAACARRQAPAASGSGSGSGFCSTSTTRSTSHQAKL